MQTSTTPLTAPAQFPILVTINTDKIVTLTYYSGPSRSCAKPSFDIECPTNFLFVLDYETSQSGWIITGTTPQDGTPALGIANGPMFQSLATIDSYPAQDEKRVPYRYSLQFANSLTGHLLQFDPQEVNVRN